MPAAQPLCASVRAKIVEQIELTLHLIDRLPPAGLDWRPPVAGAWPAAVVLGHLLECAAGFCAVLAAVEPERLAHFAELRQLPVNHACPPKEAAARLATYRDRIDEDGHSAPHVERERAKVRFGVEHGAGFRRDGAHSELLVQ